MHKTSYFLFLMENSILKKIGSVDVKLSSHYNIHIFSIHIFLTKQNDHTNNNLARALLRLISDGIG